MNLDVEDFLNPISDSETCGEDLSFSNEFHDIKKAKTQDDPLLDLGDWVSEPKQSDWLFVANTSEKLLKEKTKDIRLLTWLSEAWSNLHGYVGIHKSLELSYRMLEQFWDAMYPEVDDGDLDQRLGLLQGLVNQLPLLIKKIPVVNQSPYYSLFDYEGFLHQQNNRLRHADSSEEVEGVQELEQFDNILSKSSKSFQQQNYQDFSQIIVQWENLKKALDQLMGLDAPSFASIDSQLENIHKTLRKIYKADLFSNSQNSPLQQDEVVESVSSSQMQNISHENGSNSMSQSHQSFQPAPQSHLQNREQAMQVLQEIADYFEKNEPHSPVSYMLQKTIKWSQMPLHEWLAQVIKSDNPLESVQELLGVQQQNPESNEW